MTLGAVIYCARSWLVYDSPLSALSCPLSRFRSFIEFWVWGLPCCVSSWVHVVCSHVLHEFPRRSCSTWSQQLSVSAGGTQAAQGKSCVTYVSRPKQQRWTPLLFQGATNYCGLNCRMFWLKFLFVPLMAAANWETLLFPGQWRKSEMKPLLAATLWQHWPSPLQWRKLERVFLRLAALWQLWI